jgi:GrpB-like predicted nucleotidyltransferase (UPF0157 family)
MVQVVDYNFHWPEQFRQLQRWIWPAVSHAAIAIEHIGSTSVPGAAAKPILDVDIVIPSRAELSEVTTRLEGLGYQSRGELGIADRYAFRPPGGPGACPEVAHHHLYVCVEGSVALRNHLLVRDHLRSHPADLAAYCALKRRLAADLSLDIDHYVEGKTQFILAILARGGFSADHRSAIQQANRAK